MAIVSNEIEYNHQFKNNTFYVKIQTNISMHQTDYEHNNVHHGLDKQTSAAELFIEFISFMCNFDTKHDCFDVPEGKITRKSQIKRGLYKMHEVADNNPEQHPYFIIDPFDLNHNPGKQIKFNEVMFH